MPRFAVRTIPGKFPRPRPTAGLGGANRVDSRRIPTKVRFETEEMNEGGILRTVYRENPRNQEKSKSPMPDAAEPACKEAPNRMGLGITPGAAAENAVAVRNIKGAGENQICARLFLKKRPRREDFRRGRAFWNMDQNFFVNKIYRLKFFLLNFLNIQPHSRQPFLNGFPNEAVIHPEIGVDEPSYRDRLFQNRFPDFASQSSFGYHIHFPPKMLFQKNGNNLPLVFGRFPDPGSIPSTIRFVHFLSPFRSSHAASTPERKPNRWPEKLTPRWKRNRENSMPP